MSRPNSAIISSVTNSMRIFLSIDERKKAEEDLLGIFESSHYFPIDIDELQEDTEVQLLPARNILQLKRILSSEILNAEIDPYGKSCEIHAIFSEIPEEAIG